MKPDAPAQEGPVRQVGKVTTTLTVTNRLDQADAARGRLPPGRIRSVTLREVLVDTGAFTLCLPADVIERLGLEFNVDVPVITAEGPATHRRFLDAFVEVEGRSGLFECMEVPEGSLALLGQVPLEVLGLEPDLKNRRLRLIPPEEHMTIL
jgi:predicted aspartyl protease